VLGEAGARGLRAIERRRRRVDVGGRIGQRLAEQAPAHEDAALDGRAVHRVRVAREHAPEHQETAAVRVGRDVDAGHGGARLGSELVELRERLVHEGVGRGEELSELARSVEDDVLDERRFLGGHRLGDVDRKRGERPLVLVGVDDFARAEPLAEEVRELGTALRVGEEPLGLRFELGGRGELPLIGRLPKFRVGSRAPEGVREGRRDLEGGEREGAVRTFFADLRAVEEVRRDEHAAKHELRSLVERSLREIGREEAEVARDFLVRQRPAERLAAEGHDELAVTTRRVAGDEGGAVGGEPLVDEVFGQRHVGVEVPVGHHASRRVVVETVDTARAGNRFDVRRGHAEQVGHRRGVFPARHQAE
jgi:hypothetical protein